MTDTLSGERVSNACLTYPADRNNPGKLGLMPDTLPLAHAIGRKRLGEEPFRCGMGARPIS